MPILLNLGLTMNGGYNFFSLRYESKTSISSFFLLQNFAYRRLVLTPNLGNLSLQFFSFLTK